MNIKPRACHKDRHCKYNLILKPFNFHPLKLSRKQHKGRTIAKKSIQVTHTQNMKIPSYAIYNSRVLAGCTSFLLSCLERWRVTNHIYHHITITHQAGLLLCWALRVVPGSTAREQLAGRLWITRLRGFRNCASWLGPKSLSSWISGSHSILWYNLDIQIESFAYEMATYDGADCHIPVDSFEYTWLAFPGPGVLGPGAGA